MFDFNEINKIQFKAGIYLRVSREDENTIVSESIHNQRAFLEAYIKNKGWLLVDIYSDDGYTGTNFNRPEFIRMIEDTKNKKINLIIVKDLSRLGRDYIETGYYVEKYFPQNSIRFIAVNDGIDTFSSDTGNDMSPFRSVINDMYARDISKKVRTVMDTKRKSGEFIGAFAPYGYKKSDKDKNSLIIDEPAAVVVKKIYMLYLSGTGLEQIAGKLDGEGIINPGSYKKKNFSNYNNPRIKSSQWSPETIRYILTNPTYTGDLTQNKYKKINYKVKKTLKINKEAWITVKDTHEPIISKEEFLEVQRLIEKRAVNEYCSKNVTHVLSGIIYCGDCGEKMTFTKTHQGEYYCICSGYKRRKNCTRHSYKESEIEETINNDIKELIKNNIDMGSLFNTQYLSFDKKDVSIKKIKGYEERLSLVRKAIKNLYEDRVGERITQEDFIQLLYEYNTESKNISRNIEEIKNLYNKYNNVGKDSLIKKIIDSDVINRVMILQLIDRILVFNDRSMKIFYKFSCNNEKSNLHEYR